MAKRWAHFRLLFDILSMKVFVRLLGHDGELLDSNLFFFDRYAELADYHRAKGRVVKADQLAAIAETYSQAAPDDDPPEAAAMAMPVPRRLQSTDAVSRTRTTNHRSIDHPVSWNPRRRYKEGRDKSALDGGQ